MHLRVAAILYTARSNPIYCTIESKEDLAHFFYKKKTKTKKNSALVTLLTTKLSIS